MHELAHIAMDRRFSLIKKPYKKYGWDFCNARLFGIDDHGELFDRALRFFFSRMYKSYGDYKYLLYYNLFTVFANKKLYGKMNSENNES